MQPECEHEYQLEDEGGMYLTGKYVCRLCSYRVSMSHEQFNQHAGYPRHYQTKDHNSETESVEEDSNTTAHDAFPRLPPTCLLISQIDSLIEICCIGI